jgi:hypothetical protein
MRLPIAICVAMIAGFSVQTWSLPHYFSPATGALYILLMQCMRHLRLWNPAGRLAGHSLVRAIPVIACAMALLRVAAVSAHVQIEPAWPRGNWERADTIRRLNRLPGPQLVFVEYGPHHQLDIEWVWNSANIDESQIVWARDMGERGNRELLRYFSDRRAWLLRPDDDPRELMPYSE